MNSDGESPGQPRPTEMKGLPVAILEASPDGIVGVNPDGVLNLWNPAAGRIFGYTEDETLGRPIAMLFQQQRAWETIFQRVKHGEQVGEQELKGRCKSGSIVDVAVNISLVESPSGEVEAMSLAIQDITERKRAENELREREQKFLTITYATNDATYDWDILYDRLTWDRGITEVFGYPSEEVENSLQWWSGHMHLEDRDRVMQGVHRALETGAERWMDKYRFRCGSGGYAVVVDRAFIARDEAGKPRRVLGGMTDITETEKARARQAALLELGDRLREGTEFEGMSRDAAEIVGRTLGVARAGYARVEMDGEQVEVCVDWTSGELPSCAGRHRLENYFQGSVEAIRRGEIVVSKNAGTIAAPGSNRQAGTSEQVRAFMYLPVKEASHVSELLYIQDTQPRRWSEQEIAFARNAADRIWAAVHRLGAEKRLRESEVQLRTIADLVPDLLWRHDPKGEANWHNRQWTDYTGQTEDDARGLGWLEVTHPDEREQTLAGFRHAMETGTPIRKEARLRSKSGEYRWFLVRSEPRSDEQGKIFQWFGAATDIQQERMALEQLRGQEERYRMLTELAPHTVWMADWDGAVTYCSAWWYEYTGLTPEETLGMGWMSVIHPDHRGKLKQAWQAAVRGGGEWNVEIPMRRASDGTYRWHLTRGLPVRDQKGRIARWIGIAVDVHDRKETSQAVQRDKALLEGLAESLLDGILIVSHEGRLLYYNQRFLEIWRIPGEIMASRSDEEALSWAINQVEDPADFRSRVSAVYQDMEHPVRRELRMKDGRVYDHFGAPVKKGEVHYGWVWTFRDITESKRIEAELRASESKHQFLNRFNEGIRELSDPGAIMAAAARLLGQHLGSSCCAYADVESGAGRFTIEKDYVEGCEGISGDYRLSLLGREARAIMETGRTLVICDADQELLAGEGTEMFRWLRARAVVSCPLVKEGRLRAMMLVHQIMPRKWRSQEVQLVEAVVERCWSTIERARAECALRESEQRFRQLADAMPQLAWTATPDGEPEFVNKRWEEYTGVKEVKNQGWLEAIHPEDRERTLSLWNEALQNQTDFGVEQRIRGEDGYRWFQTRAVPIKDANGKASKWFGTATDIDEVVKAREMLARTQGELERLVVERTAKLQETIAQLEAFSYSISHDMRGPLRAMQGFSYLLLQRFKDTMDPEGVEYLQVIERSAKRLDSLIQDVLSYSRIAREAVHLEPVPVSRLIRDIVNQYPGLQAPQAEVRIEEPLPRVLAQPSYLTQVLSNLLSNAVKFVPPERKPEITITSQRRDGTVRLFIQDNGVGIAPKDQERIFNIFERVYSQQEYEGTGIGLSIVRKAMDRMDGRVGVNSRVGEGSCFWIELKEAGG